MGTLRKQIISLLEEEYCDARMISQRLGISEREAYDHLQHIARSVAAQSRKLITTPARCISCGFQFRQREKISKPGRCPLCKKERIEPTRFRIE